MTRYALDCLKTEEIYLAGQLVALAFQTSYFLKQHLDREQLIIEWFPHATSWTILLNFVIQSRF